MKKINILIIAIMAAFCLSACSGGNSNASSATGENGGANTPSAKKQIVTTIFPEYDWVMNILGDDPAGVEVTMLLDNGVDLHSFQPTASDIMKIATCDLFIYVGGESDEWVEDALKEATNKNMIVVDLLSVLGDAVKEEEVIEGMQEEHEHDHEHEHEEEGPEYDEHVWLSLKNAAVIVDKLAAKVADIDPEHADTYKKNAASYVQKLNALDAEYSKAVDGASVKVLLFGDRFPFRYLTDDYGLKYYAAFVGCSAETEASFETVTFLAQKMDEEGLHAVMTIEGTDHRIAETIVKNTASGDQKILSLDSMQSTTSKDAAGGVTYLSVMEKNLSVLKEALK
ncbi:MAG: zinc ABC transporter substrate-binding protein [Lachnospiraceae bacterium]|nr:zinc ABC transporter substrate-binding protein [Lachnospiraceae bacterium]